MEIGMQKVWKNQAKIFLNNMYGDIGRIAQIYFGNRNYEGLGYVLYGFFKNIMKEDHPQDAFYHSCENENFYGDREDIVRKRKNIVDVIKKRFDIDIDYNDPRLIR